MPLSKLYGEVDEAERLGPDTFTFHSDAGPLYGEGPREHHGGLSLAGAFFGGLVAIAMTVLLAGVFGAGATAFAKVLDITRHQAEQQAGTIGSVCAVALFVILAIAYYTGGYVAGRMSRFVGGRQGLGVWFLGLLGTILVAVLGALVVTRYDVIQQADLPAVPVPTNMLTVAGVVAIVLATLVFAIVGGKVGQRYHAEIDRAVG